VGESGETPTHLGTWEHVDLHFLVGNLLMLNQKVDVVVERGDRAVPMWTWIGDEGLT